MRRSTLKRLSTAVSAALVTGLMVVAPTSAGAADLTVIDDFESGLPSGSAVPNGEPIGFYTFQGEGDTIAIDTVGTPPAPVLPAVGTPNNAMQMTVDSTGYAGFIHGFENGGVDKWVTQDWSTREGISFWFHGANSGAPMFIDLLDNRNDGSTKDDAERWTYDFTDDSDEWKLFELPFSSFTRKEIGNGAPNDGLGLFEMHGYAIGTLQTGGAKLFYVDDVNLYGVAVPPPVAVNFSRQNTTIEEGATGQVAVKLNRPLGSVDGDPAEVSIDFATERSNAIPGQDFTPTSGTLTFVKDGPRELFFPVETFDNSKFTGDKQIVIRLTNPVGVERGALFQGSVLIEDNDKYDPSLLDDFEQGAYLWSGDPDVAISAPTIKKGDALHRPGQDDVESVMEVRTPVGADLVAEIDIKGSVCKSGNGVITVQLLSTTDFDATQVDHATVKFGDAAETHTSGRNKTPTRHVADLNGDGLKDLVFHFRANQTGYDCGTAAKTLTGLMSDGRSFVANGAVGFGRDFPIDQNWSKGAGLSFWYYGTGSGDDVTLTVKENRKPDPGPAGWNLAWSDEFNAKAGTPPNQANWAYEIGDTTPDGKNGWGNEELQYYTDDPDNAQTDGKGHLVIKLDESDGSQECYYGPCEFESARLITQNKAEFAYGRIESRVQVPSGGDGLWPAFWSLGTDITYNPWPGAGEIDVMEYVSRVPNEVFGTIHGPGYSGGASFGGTYDFTPKRVDRRYHTFAVEWEPNLINWYVDGIKYHTATPSDVAPNDWVFEKQFFLLLNFAIGGNFGGAPDPTNTYPQEYKVDYVRVYQAPDTAERWETSFVDSVEGWHKVTVPFDVLTRSADQPADAPDDGLSLKEVWGYGFEPANGGTSTGKAMVDLVRLERELRTVTVTNLNDSGEGSLREALGEVAEADIVLFDPSLAGGIVPLESPLKPSGDVVIDAKDAPGIALDGGGDERVLIVDAGRDVTVKGLTMTNGYGYELAGGVLNNGTLTLDGVTVSGNRMETNTSVDPNDRFYQGGGGIYSGDGASLTLVDSTVSNNTAGWSGGGIYLFKNTTTSISSSTISGNISNDVGGGLRTLGTLTIDNSTISGNKSTGWHGGAIFQTDGDVAVSNSTITDNAGPDWAQSALFIGQFGGDFVPSLTLTNSTVTGNQWYGCEKFASGTTGNVVSGGNNVFQDDTCNPIASDVVLPPG